METAEVATHGKVVSLHLHAESAELPLRPTESVRAVKGRGLEGDFRYFGRGGGRQVTLVEREQILGHAAALALDSIAPGCVRSNVETEGIDLVALVGRKVQVGGAVLRFREPRTPCGKMEAIASGLRGRMENGRQGVIAEVLSGGEIRVGDPIRLMD
jgi:MOSC domain-containing protein YiiM